jgi:hypothetical protein
MCYQCRFFAEPPELPCDALAFSIDMVTKGVTREQNYPLDEDYNASRSVSAQREQF